MTTCACHRSAMPADRGGCAGRRQAAFRAMATAEAMRTLRCFGESCRARRCGCRVTRRSWALAGRHPGADFGAQFVDQLEAALGLDVPEGPAVAGGRALRHPADAMDGADPVAEHDGAVRPDHGAL